MYLQSYDADLYELWASITRGDVENPSQVIAGTFDSRYVHTDLNHRDSCKLLQKTPD